MPEELVGADGEVGVEKDFQATFLTRDITLESTIGQSSSRRGKRMERNIKDWLLDKRECECGFHPASAGHALQLRSRRGYGVETRSRAEFEKRKAEGELEVKGEA